MQHVFDPAVAAVEAALRKAEGPYNVLSTYYSNADDAVIPRREIAIELTRIVDRTRLSVALVRLMDRNGKPLDEDNTAADEGITT